MAAILAFAGSNSANSINFRLVQYTAYLVEGKNVDILNMSNYPFPMYSEDVEKAKGFSNSLIELRDDIKNAGGLIVSVNEHNSYPSAYFKNLMDWMSRLERNFLEGKKIFLMAASPGGRGAIGAMEVAEKMFTRFGGEVVSKFSLPNFYKNFEIEEGLIEADLAAAHQEALDAFIEKL